MSNRFIGRLDNGKTVLVFGDSDTEDLSKVTKLFEFPDISDEQALSFEVGKGLAKDEWFYITLSVEDKVHIIDSYLSVFNSSTGYNKISLRDYRNLSALYLIHNNAEDIIFNRISAKYFVESKTLLKVDINGPAITTPSNSVEFSGKVDAFWNKNSSRLYFRNFSVIKPMFDGIEKFYRSASKDETDQFLNNDFFSVEQTFAQEKVGSRALSNIAMILDKNEIDFTNVTVRKQYTDYSQKYSEYGIQIENGKFKITSPADLTKVINILQQRLYKTEITGESRVADHSAPIN